MYVIERFGTITLPIYNTEWPLAPVPARTSFVDTSSGVFDNDGDGRNEQQFPFALPYSGIIWEDALLDTRASLDLLRVAVGTRKKLYRRARDNDEIHTCIARLSSAPQTWPYSQKGWFVVQLNFEQLTPWRGGYHDGWTLDDGVLFDEGHTLDEVEAIFELDYAAPGVQTFNTVVVPNGGNLPVRDVIISITPGNSPITQLEINNETTICYPYYLGTIDVGDTLVIDAGACSVTDPINRYNDFGLLTPTFHKNEHWFELAPEDNTIVVAKKGGGTGTIIQFSFRDGWA